MPRNNSNQSMLLSTPSSQIETQPFQPPSSNTLSSHALEESKNVIQTAATLLEKEDSVRHDDITFELDKQSCHHQSNNNIGSNFNNDATYNIDEGYLGQNQDNSSCPISSPLLGQI